MSDKTTDFLYYVENWSGNSRDGKAKDIDGYHYLKMDEAGKILEAYEFYETLEGEKIVTTVPEMAGVSWLKDLGYQDFDDLDAVTEDDFEVVCEAALEKKNSTSSPS